MSDDRSHGLEWLRDLLASRLEEDEEGRLTAGLAREYRAVLSEIDALPSSEARSTLDELTARREGRRPA